LVAEAKVNIFVSKSHNKLQLMLIRNKKIMVKNANCGILAKIMLKHSILAKSQHLKKITVSVISVLP